MQSLIDPACERGQQEVGLRVDAPQLLLRRLVAEQAEQQVIHGTRVLPCQSEYNEAARACLDTAPAGRELRRGEKNRDSNISQQTRSKEWYAISFVFVKTYEKIGRLTSLTGTRAPVHARTQAGVQSRGGAASWRLAVGVNWETGRKGQREMFESLDGENQANRAGPRAGCHRVVAAVGRGVCRVEGGRCCVCGVCVCVCVCGVCGVCGVVCVCVVCVCVCVCVCVLVGGGWWWGAIWTRSGRDLDAADAGVKKGAGHAGAWGGGREPAPGHRGHRGRG